MPFHYAAIRVIAFAIGSGIQVVSAAAGDVQPDRDAETRPHPPGVRGHPQSAEPLSRGKAGVDRFDLDTSRVRESVKADGTVIIELNGEGMDKATLTVVDGSAAMRCGSLLETRAGEARPTRDFRHVGSRPGHDDAHR